MIATKHKGKTDVNANVTEAIIQKRLLTAEEYHAMGKAGILHEDDRIELINGEIVEMSPIGTLHFNCVNRLTMLLVPLLVGKAIVSVQNPVRLNNNTEPEPDVVVLKNKNYTTSPLPEEALLIIEVADSTLRYDRYVKIPLYAEAKVAEVWIVNLSRDQVEVYTNPQDGNYQNKQTFEGDAVIQATQIDVVQLTPSQILE